MITLTDIAEKAGVAVSTVSRVLNNKAQKYRISKATRDLVLQAAKELNYHPNELARGLRLNKTHTIGLMVPDISNPFFAYITHVIQTQASQYGYSLIVCSTNENINTEVEQIELLRRKGIDGYIIMPIGTKYEHIEELLNLNKPVVLIDRCIDELNTNSVSVDNYTGAYNAVEHLINKGHTRIAIIQGLPNTSTNTARVNGYKDALTKNGITVNPNYIVGNDFRKENGYIETKLLINLESRPTAIFSTSDLITLGALEAISEENLSIPDDISVVAFDDVDFAPFLFAPLTAVRQPRELMGEVAVKILIENISTRTNPQKKSIVLKPELIVRKSVLDLGRVHSISA